jgi:hypothetical protein
MLYLDFFSTDSHDLSHFGDRLMKTNDNEITVVNLKKTDMMVLQCNASNIRVFHI